VLDRGGDLEAGIVDEHVDGTGGAGGLDHPLDAGDVGDVELGDRHRQALQTQALEAVAPGRVPQSGVDVMAGLGELLGDQQAKAAVGAGDEDVEGHGCGPWLDRVGSQ